MQAADSLPLSGLDRADRADQTGDRARAFRPVDALLAAGGPMAVGAALGLIRGPFAVLPGLLALPAVIAGVAAVMIPALYIGAAMAGVAPPARIVVTAVARGFRACGVVMLGLAAPALFLLATTHALAVPLGGAVLVAGVLAGLRILFDDLFAAPSLLVGCAFAAWSLVAMALGAHLFMDFVIA